MREYFNYDAIIILDGSISDISKKLKLIQDNKDYNNLALTFNHRKFTIDEKNNIKTEIDNLNLDHLVFSIRPSYKKIKYSGFFGKKKNLNIFLQILFAVKCSKLYGIKKIYLTDIYFKFLNSSKKLKALFKEFKILNNNFKNKKNFHSKTITFFKSLDYKDFFNLSDLIFQTYPKNVKLNKKIFNQKYISRKESNLFWLNFDGTFQEVNFIKKHKVSNNIKKLKKKSKIGSSMFPKLKYCSRCCLPETLEGIKFNKYGICSFCNLSEDKMNIEWEARSKLLKNKFNKHKNENYYDCLLPISGGKDSTFQSYVLTNIYKLNPLSITHGNNWMSKTGRANLENCLSKFDLDNLILIPSRKKINIVANQSLQKIGDACWHCHIGVGAFTMQVSLDWKLKLLVFGEAISDNDSRSNFNQLYHDPYFFVKLSAKKTSEEFVNKSLTKKKISLWSYPKKQKIKEFKPELIALGQYIFWDEQKNIEFINKLFGWKKNKVENTYKTYKSNECIMAGVHDYLNFLKRGVGRSTLHVSEDIRRGLISKEDGFEIIKQYDSQIPHAMEYYKKITGFSDKDIEKNILKGKRLSKYAKKFRI